MESVGAGARPKRRLAQWPAMAAQQCSSVDRAAPEMENLATGARRRETGGGAALGCWSTIVLGMRCSFTVHDSKR